MTPAQFIKSLPHEIDRPPIAPADEEKYWSYGHPQFAAFELGTRVIKKVHRIGDRTEYKLDNYYTGPYEIVYIDPSNVSYKIKTLTGPNRGNILLAHHKQLREWREVPEYLAIHPTYLKLMENVEYVAPPPPLATSESEDSPSPVRVAKSPPKEKIQRIIKPWTGIGTTTYGTSPLPDVTQQRATVHTVPSAGAQSLPLPDRDEEWAFTDEQDAPPTYHFRKSKNVSWPTSTSETRMPKAVLPPLDSMTRPTGQPRYVPPLQGTYEPPTTTAEQTYSLRPVISQVINNRPLTSTVAKDSSTPKIIG